MEGSKFYYFGFGSNMLAKRIHIENPTAQRVDIGRLEHYRLDFHTKSNNWLGAPATIVPDKSTHVYGAIWEIDRCSMDNLDRQESVDLGIYTPITVQVLSCSTLQVLHCRAYHLTNQPVGDVKAIPMDEVPTERQPSKTYLKTLIKGAVETGIPGTYVNWLRGFKHNNVLVAEMEEQLGLATIDV